MLGETEFTLKELIRTVNMMLARLVADKISDLDMAIVQGDGEVDAKTHRRGMELCASVFLLSVMSKTIKDNNAEGLDEITREGLKILEEIMSEGFVDENVKNFVEDKVQKAVEDTIKIAENMAKFDDGEFFCPYCNEQLKEFNNKCSSCEKDIQYPF